MGKYLKPYEIFFDKAKVDYNLAKYALNGFINENLEIDLEVINFHLQQCAEKLLKCLLDYNSIKFIKVHDIKLLIKILNDNSIGLIENIETLIPLTDYAVEGRYAIIHDDLTDADMYLDLLDNFIEFVQISLSKKC
jgi:HEPN domain-containing protein